jgi:hypothetical protein
MRTDFRSRLGRASAAIAVGLVALMSVASPADAQTWNRWLPYNGYNNSTYPYYNRSWDPGWTWGERYGAPPSGPYYPAPSSYGSRRYYGNRDNNGYFNRPSAPGQLGGLFVR